MASHNVSRAAVTVERTEAQLEAEQVEISKYQTLVSEIDTKIRDKEYTPQTFALTSKLLRKNPEYYTIWNARRRLLIHFFSSKPSASSLPSTVSQPTTQISELTTPSGKSSYSAVSSLADSNKTLLDREHQRIGESGITTDERSDGYDDKQDGKDQAEKLEALVLEEESNRQSEILQYISSDLRFVIPLLKEWPKCYWIWNYRIWLLLQANSYLPADQARQLWLGELALASVMLGRDSRNFHGWGYRRMVVSQLESEELNGKSMVGEEFDYTTRMIQVSLSNFSAWHSRSKLIPRLLNERNADDTARRKFLEEELELMRHARWTDETDQSVWFYYQFLITTLLYPSSFDIIAPNLSLSERITYAEEQLADLRDMLDGADNPKWILNALFEYTVAICKLQERKPALEEEEDLRSWLGIMRKIDPLRKGRWDALEAQLVELSSV